MKNMKGNDQNMLIDRKNRKTDLRNKKHIENKRKLSKHPKNKGKRKRRTSLGKNWTKN